MSHIQGKFQTDRLAHGQQRLSKSAPRVPKKPRFLYLTKLMALAIRLEHLLATGEVKDQAEIARVGRVTRARVTQILNLTSLAPDIQTAILNFAPTTMQRDQFKEREVRQIAGEPNWEKQRDLFQRLFAKQDETSVFSGPDQKAN